MSMALMAKAMGIKVGNPLRKLVLIKLADNASDNGECWPSVNTIAGDIKLSPATVRRAIKDLKKAGLIETEQRYREKGGKSSLLFRLVKQ